MSIYPPPYLLDYRVARALMAEGNIGPVTLSTLLDEGDAFFFDGQRADFEKCPLCNVFVASHKECFVKPIAGDLQVQGAIASKLIQKGKLLPARQVMATPTLRMAGIAVREGLTCIVQPNQVLFDNIAAYRAAHVQTITLADFMASLKP